MDALNKKPFYFVRHGKTDWNEKSLCQGQVDVPLNEKGRKEIEDLCPLLFSLQFSKIWSSPLKRALESAQIIQNHSSVPLEILEDLKERGWGEREGYVNTHMYQIEEEEEKNRDFIPGYGIENRSAFRSRLIQGLNLVLSHEAFPLIVSHGRVFLVLSEILQVPLVRQIPNATVIECCPKGNKWEVKLHHA